MQINPSIAILMCTCQGEQFLFGQLDSIESQKHRNWIVLVSDDSSIDDTRLILEKYRSRWCDERLSIVCGPSAGFAANFRSLTCHSGIDADFFAWSDQDDIWEPEKLARALDWLQSVPADIPALYGTRTLLTDESNQPIGMSPLFTKPPCFANALVQSIAGGNTMVFNRAARTLLVEANAEGEALPPDWLAYLVVTACGGRVHYDPWPSVRYRQHGGNLSGSNISLTGRWRRLKLLLEGQFRGWIDANLEALERVRHRMPAHNQKILDTFIEARRQTLARRLIDFRRAGIHRQTTLGNVGLTVAALLNRI